MPPMLLYEMATREKGLHYSEQYRLVAHVEVWALPLRSISSDAALCSECPEAMMLLFNTVMHSFNAARSTMKNLAGRIHSNACLLIESIVSKFIVVYKILMSPLRCIQGIYLSIIDAIVTAEDMLEWFPVKNCVLAFFIYYFFIEVWALELFSS